MEDSVVVGSRTLAQAARLRIEKLTEHPFSLRAPAQPQAWYWELAAVLAGCDADPKRPIGLFIEGSPRETSIALAALASGRSLILLHAGLPEHVLSAVLEESRVCALLMEKERAFNFSKIVYADSPLGDAAPLLEPEPEEDALLIMTSGSTGSRKLFNRSHGALVKAAHERIGGFELNSTDRVLSFTPLHFTGGMNQTATAIVGSYALDLARLVDCAEEGSRAFLERINPTVINGTPSVLKNILSDLAPASLPNSLRLCSTSGELITSRLVENFYRLAPRTAGLCASYGSTESGTVLIARLGRDLASCEGPLPLGVPLRGVEVLVVDEHDQPVDTAKIGRVMTRSSFQVSEASQGMDPRRLRPIDGQGAEPWLDIGDSGMMDHEGRLTILGRADDERLYGGIRFRPAAIEAALLSISGVSAVVFDVIELEGTSPLLIAAFELDSTKTLELARAALSEMGSLEGDAIVMDLGPFKLNSVGKLDRPDVMRRAEEMLKGDAERQDSGAKLSRLELLITDQWRELLGVERPKKHIHWELLGGDSLGLITLAVELEKRFGIKLPMERLYGLRTIASQAAFVEACNEEPKLEEIVRLAGDSSSEQVVVCLAGIGGHPWSFVPIANELADFADVLGLTWASEQDIESPEDHLGQLAQQLEARCRGRSISMIGFSVGARVAWDLARRLMEHNVELKGVVFLDGPPEMRARSLMDRVRAFWTKRTAPRGGVDRYLAQIEKNGRLVNNQIQVEPLSMPVLEVCSRGVMDLGWERFVGRVQRINIELEHLELVRSPVSLHLSRTLRERLGAR
ncbi:MAG: AMP-binding protein [Planctomycetota bacterium]|nr:AMP-binding protein [Planctomycetota bacterium]